MKFTHDEFKKHLMDFNNSFKFSDENSNFKPCDYEFWRKIAKAANNAISVVVVHNSRDKTIEALFNIGGKDSIITLGTSHDGSLGEYFYNILFPLKTPVVLEAPIALSDTVNANMTKINANALEGVIINGIDFDLGTKADKIDVYNDISTLNDRIDNILNKIEKIEEKENKTMNMNNTFNFDFGAVADDQARMSMYGIAVKNPSGQWVAYDQKNEQMMNVDILNFEGANMLYKMPVAINQVKAGSVVIHNRKPMFVISFLDENKAFNVVDIYAGEQKIILPTKSPFGFDFMTQIVSPMNFGAANADNPFGNMLPFFLMNGNDNIDPMMLMLMSQQNGNMMGMNPMMMFALFGNKDGKSDDMMKMLMMSQMMAGATPSMTPPAQ